MAETVKEQELAQGQVEAPYPGLAQVKAIVAFASAKGGTGKSTIAANIAAALALKGRKIGVVDGDLDAPSVAPMLGLPRVHLTETQGAFEPASGPFGIRIVADDPMKSERPAVFAFDNLRPELDDSPPGGQLEPFTSAEDLIAQTRFGALDLLLIDLPPGFKYALRLAQSIERAGVVIVLPSSGAAAVRQALGQARHKHIKILGLIENMAGFYCGNCHSVRPLLPSSDISALARDFDLPILARLPFDPRLAEACDTGRAFLREYPDLPLSKLLNEAAQTLLTAASTPHRRANANIDAR
jgi:ATP-binding protein involved in chromosome partitioning